MPVRPVGRLAVEAQLRPPAGPDPLPLVAVRDTKRDVPLGATAWSVAVTGGCEDVGVTSGLVVGAAATGDGGVGKAVEDAVAP